MTRFWTAGLISLPLVALLFGGAQAATDFEDIPYLQARINQVLEREPTGAEVEWRNQATGNSGVIRVLKTYFPSPDAPCRDYERTTRSSGGGESLVRGTGCRDASGRWGLKEMEESEALETRSPSAEPPTPEAWEAGSPAAGGAAETAAPALPGEWAQPSGGQGGGQGGTQSQGQSQGQSGSAGQGGQTPSSVSTSVLPSVAEPEAAAETGSEAPEPTAPAPRESAPSQPDIELPTRSE